MKKSIMFLSLVLTCVLMCGLLVGNSMIANKNVYAKSFDGQHIIVVGKGEVEVEPDTVKVSFGLKCRAENLQAGQTKIRETIDNATNKIKEYNKDTEVYTNYLSSYPVFENGLLAYEFDCCLVAKSSDVKDANGLVDAIVDAGATSVHSATYLLSNKEDAYIKALVSAKENAENKVKAIYENVTLKGLKEEAVYNYCEGSHGEKIKITAKVNACYEIGSLQENIQAKNSSLKKAFETSSKEATSTQANSEEELSKLEEIKFEERETLKSKLKNNKISEENKEQLITRNKAKKESLQNNEESEVISTTSKNENLLNEDSKLVKQDLDVSSESVLNNTEKTASNTSATTLNSNTSKLNKRGAETRKIVDASGNVVVEII